MASANVGKDVRDTLLALSGVIEDTLSKRAGGGTGNSNNGASVPIKTNPDIDSAKKTGAELGKATAEAAQESFTKASQSSDSPIDTKAAKERGRRRAKAEKQGYQEEMSGGGGTNPPSGGSSGNPPAVPRGRQKVFKSMDDLKQFLDAQDMSGFYKELSKRVAQTGESSGGWFKVESIKASFGKVLGESGKEIGEELTQVVVRARDRLGNYFDQMMTLPRKEKNEQNVDAKYYVRTSGDIGKTERADSVLRKLYDATVSKSGFSGVGNDEKKALDDAKNAYDASPTAKSWDELRKAIVKVNAVIKENAAGKPLKDMEKQAEDLKARLDSISKSNLTPVRKAMVETATAQQKAYDDAIFTGDTEAAKKHLSAMAVTVKQLENGFESATAGSNKFTNSVAHGIKQLLGLSSPYMLMMKVVSTIKKMASEVTAVDTAMVELRKVTNETGAAYNMFLSRAGANAKALGSSISDLVNTTSIFARMGYNLSEAEGLGKVATIFANVGDFSNVEDAASSLISIMRGFDLAASDAQSISDKLNEVANNYAATAAEVAEGLGNSASALSVAGVDVDQAIAMITTISEVTRDASGAGNALKVLSLRIRGAKTELEASGESTDDMAESTSKLQDKIKALTNVTGKGGVDIMASPTEFKDTYNILLEISKVWDKMSDIDQSALLELLAGKVRSNQVSALLTNMTRAEEILATSQNSDGSSLREHERWLDSVEAKQQQLTASFQELSQTVADSSLIKGAYGTGSKFLDILNQLINGTSAAGTGFSTLVAAAYGTRNKWATPKVRAGVTDAYDSAINAKKTADEAKAAASSLYELTDAEYKAMAAAKESGTTLSAYTKSMSGMAGMAKTLGATLKSVSQSLLVFVLAEAAVWAINKAWTALDKSVFHKQKYLDEAAATANTDYEKAKSDLDEVQKKLTENEEKIGELKSKGPLSIVDESDLSTLDKQNKALKTQLEIQKKIADAKRTSMLAANRASYENRYSMKPAGETSTFDKIKYVTKDTTAEGISDDSFSSDDVITHLDRVLSTRDRVSELISNASINAAQSDSKESIEFIQKESIILGKINEKIVSAYEDVRKDYMDNLQYADTVSSEQWFKDMRSKYAKLSKDVLGDSAEKDMFNEAVVNNASFSDANDQLELAYKNGVDLEAVISNAGGELSVFIDYLHSLGIETSMIIGLIEENVSGVTEQIKEAALSADTLLASFDKVEAGVKAVSDAMKNAGTGAISADDYKALVDAGEEWAALVKEVDGVMQIDQDAYANLVSSKMTELQAQNLQMLTESKTKYAESLKHLSELTLSLNGAEEDNRAEIIKNISTEKDNLKALESSMKAYDLLASRIQYATSAYKKWVDAKGGQESGAEYDEMRTAYEDLKTARKDGRMGTNVSKAAVEYFLGGGAYDAKQEKKLGRYVTEDSTGVRNFQKDLIKNKFLGADGAVNGTLDIDKIATQMGLGSEFVRAMFEKMNEYITDDTKKYKIDRPSIGDATDTANKLTEARKAYETEYDNFKAGKDGSSPEKLQAAMTAYQQAADAAMTEIDLTSDQLAISAQMQAASADAMTDAGADMKQGGSDVKEGGAAIKEAAALMASQRKRNGSFVSGGKEAPFDSTYVTGAASRKLEQAKHFHGYEYNGKMYPTAEAAQRAMEAAWESEAYFRSLRDKDKPDTGSNSGANSGNNSGSGVGNHHVSGSEDSEALYRKLKIRVIDEDGSLDAAKAKIDSLEGTSERTIETIDKDSNLQDAADNAGLLDGTSNRSVLTTDEGGALQSATVNVSSLEGTSDRTVKTTDEDGKLQAAVIGAKSLDGTSERNINVNGEQLNAASDEVENLTGDSNRVITITDNGGGLEDATEKIDDLDGTSMRSVNVDPDGNIDNAIETASELDVPSEKEVNVDPDGNIEAAVEMAAELDMPAEKTVNVDPDGGISDAVETASELDMPAEKAVNVDPDGNIEDAIAKAAGLSEDEEKTVDVSTTTDEQYDELGNPIEKRITAKFAGYTQNGKTYSTLEEAQAAASQNKNVGDEPEIDELLDQTADMQSVQKERESAKKQQLSSGQINTLLQAAIEGDPDARKVLENAGVPVYSGKSPSGTPFDSDYITQAAQRLLGDALQDKINKEPKSSNKDESDLNNTLPLPSSSERVEREPFDLGRFLVDAFLSLLGVHKDTVINDNDDTHGAPDFVPVTPLSSSPNGSKQTASDDSSTDKPTYAPGNIDLSNRPIYRNEDGSFSTVDSMSFSDESGYEILIPTIARDEDGNPARLTEEQAIERYYQTGEHLGKFSTVEEADAYAELLHKAQAELYKQKAIGQVKSPEEREIERQQMSDYIYKDVIPDYDIFSEDLPEKYAEQQKQFLQVFGDKLTTANNKDLAGKMLADFISVDSDSIADKIALVMEQWNSGAYGEQTIQFDVEADSKNAAAEIAKLTAPETKIITAKIISPTQALATGTHNARGGISLVDEKGQELIEHADGTYELGTNSGARMTELQPGDVVHTAEETKKIKQRGGIEVGPRFVAGSSFQTSDQVTGGATIAPKATSSNKSSSKNNAKSALAWAKKLVDWIPTAIKTLKKTTENYIKQAADAIGYLAKNVKIDKAMQNVRAEIDLSQKAYNRYMKQADTFAKKASLSKDIIKLIQNGTINIKEYDENTRNVIAEYQKWWELAQGVKDSTADLKDQLKELARQKLDNIVKQFENINSLTEAKISTGNGKVDLKKQNGEEVKASDYNKQIDAYKDEVKSLEAEQTALTQELEALVADGTIEVGSDAWYEYAAAIENINSKISEAKVQIGSLGDTVSNIALNNLKAGADALTRIGNGLQGVLDLADAQGTTKTAGTYQMMISNGAKQIENLEKQNEEIAKQMEGVDMLSDKGKELQSQYDANVASINGIKQEQEKWNDAIIDLDIEKLRKQNEAYRQQRDVMDALNNLQDASQRKMAVYHEGVGFTYEADQNEVKAAQDNLDDVVESLIESQLDASKELSNIYDALGHQLVEIEDLFKGIDFTSYYDSLSSGTENSALLSDVLSKINIEEIISRTQGGTGSGLSIDLSGMTLNGVSSAEELGNAILSQLPNYLLQYIHEK